MYSSFAPRHLAAAAFSLLFVPGVAHAHITLTDPPARHGPNDQKVGPCGIAQPDGRTTDASKITEYTAGETIDITFNETIQHDGHYRVMLSSTGDAAFVEPTGYEDTSVSEGDLADGVMDEDAEEAHTITVTLPNEPCEECTLQLVQVMYDKMPWGDAGGADLYYQCADIVIVPGEDTGSGGATGSGGGTGSGGTGSGGAPVASGGAPAGSGGSPVGSGGAPAGSGGAVGVGGSGAPVDPGTGASCSLQPGRLGDSSGAAWLGLAGLTWLVVRKRRALARRA